MALQPLSQEINSGAVRLGQNTSITFIPEGQNTAFPYSGITNLTTSPTHIKSGAWFCTDGEMSEITFEPVQSTDVVLGGFKAPLEITVGKKFSFTVEFLGNSLSALLALHGKPADTKVYVPKTTVNIGKVGHIIVESWSANPITPAISKTQILLNCSARITMGAGKTTDGESRYTVEFYNMAAETSYYETGKNVKVAFELWADDNGSIANSVFGTSSIVLGTGNGSYASATTPNALLLPLSGTAATLGVYAFYASLNGTEVDRNTYAFNAATETITTPSALASTGTFLMIYGLDASAFTSSIQWPHGQSVASNDSQVYPWTTYYGGQ